MSVALDPNIPVHDQHEPHTARLTLFGTMQIAVRGQTVPITSKPMRALLGYLVLNATNGRAVPRAVVAEQLWPDLPESRARQALNDTLYRLRQTLDKTDAWLVADAATLRLHNIVTDVASFRLLAARGTLADWQAAAKLYVADLLADLDAAWLLVPRMALQDTFIHLLAHICTALAETGQVAAALDYARQWVHADLFNEHAHRMLIRLYARLGRYAAALQHYDQLVALLEEELQTAPLPDTRALALAIRAEYHAVPEPHPPVRPFVGRGAACAQLLAALEAAQHGRGGIITIEGEPGIGKTRLLQIVADSARWRGLRVVHATVPQATPRSPYAPLDDALRAALAGPVADQMDSDLATQAADLLAALRAPQPTRLHEHALGTLAASGNQGNQCGSGPNIPPQPYTPAAFGEVIGALSRVAPHVLLFDDMQWAADDCWTTLQACAARIAQQRVLVVLSYRSAALRAQPRAWHTLRALDRVITAQHITLHGLAAEECAALAQAHGVTLDTAAAQHLHQRSGGNPLFVLELLAAGVEQQATESLSAVFEGRLAHLSPAARLALETAAVIGHEFRYEIWYMVVGAGLSAVAPALVAQEFLDEIANGYRFRHGMLREHIYATLSEERRQVLHRRIATALRHDPAIAAWHYDQAGSWEGAIHAYQAAGDQAINAGDYTAAQTYYERALTITTQQIQQTGGQGKIQASWQHALDLEARWRAIHPTLPPVPVQLARAGVPLGRRLTDADRVTVQWIVDAGALDATILRAAGKVALRRHRIVRLCAEAQAQGAAPTAHDLADALSVTERTIITDINAMRAAGLHITTRHRRAANG